MNPEQEPPPPHVAAILAALIAAGRPAPERVQVYWAAPPGTGSAPDESVLCAAVRWADDTAALWDEVRGWRVVGARPAAGARLVTATRAAAGDEPERIAMALLAGLEAS
ncbi:hypothetical protein ACGFMM_01225 [Streptomyces sp. NPDC048604]|uniref:hypothetical protein n=1 Tax=Streptomyces sp. NPDC048604 TaxID=3365578 RepID=UPI00371C1303